MSDVNGGAPGRPQTQVLADHEELPPSPRIAVTVVIPTHNRLPGLEAMLGDLLGQRTAAGLRFEVLVIDSDEGADVSQVIERSRHAGLDVRLLLTRNVVAAKRNAGVREARGELIAFADDDMRLPPGWVEAHVDAHAAEPGTDENGRMVCGAVEFPAGWIAGSNYYRYKNSRQLNSTRQVRGSSIPAYRVVTMNGSIPRDLYLRLGGSVEAFERYGGEDVELGLRLARAGVSIRYSADALAEHHEVTADVIQFMDKVRIASLSSDRVMGLAPEAVEAPTFRWTEPGIRRSGLDSLIHFLLLALAHRPIVGGLSAALRATDGWRHLYSPLPYKILTLLATQLGVKQRSGETRAPAPVIGAAAASAPAASRAPRLPSVVVKFRAPMARAVAVLASVMLTWQVSALLTRFDNKAEIGAWSVIFTAMFAIGTVTRWGCDTLAVRSTATDASVGRSMARASLTLIVMFSLPGAVCLGLLAYSRSAVRVSSSPVEIALAVGLVLLALNLTVLAGSWLRALGYVASGALLELGATPALTIAILGAYAQFEVIDLAHVVGAYTVSAWLTAVMMMTWAVRRLRRVPIVSTEWRTAPFWRAHRVQLGRFMVTGLGFFLFSYLAILVFGAFGDDASAADYRNCYTLAGLVATLPTMQLSYLTPRFAELFHRGQMAELQALVWRSTRNATAVGGVLALPLLLFPGTALRVVFGDAYVHAAPMLRILAACAVAVVAIGPIYSLMTMTGLERSASRVIALSALTGVVVMSAAYVVSGATAATAASVLPPLVFVFRGHLALRRLGIDSSVLQYPVKAGARRGTGTR